MHIGIDCLVNGHVKIECCQKVSFYFDDIVSMNEPAALGDEVSYFGWIDLVHLGSKQKASNGYFFSIIVIEWEGQLVEDGDG